MQVIWYSCRESKKKLKFVGAAFYEDCEINVIYNKRCLQEDVCSDNYVSTFILQLHLNIFQMWGYLSHGKYKFEIWSNNNKIMLKTKPFWFLAPKHQICSTNWAMLLCKVASNSKSWFKKPQHNPTKNINKSVFVELSNCWTTSRLERMRSTYVSVLYCVCVYLNDSCHRMARQSYIWIKYIVSGSSTRCRLIKTVVLS